MEIRVVLAGAVRSGASDVHLKVGAPPMLRIHGDLIPVDGAPRIDREAMQTYLAQLMPDHHRERLARAFQVDFAYGEPSLGRFRVNVFYQRGEPAIEYLRTSHFSWPPSFLGRIVNQ